MRGINGSSSTSRSWLIAALLVALPWPAQPAEDPSIAPARMARIGTVDERFQSYNVEMVEVTGGAFWKPYGSGRSAGHSELISISPADRSGQSAAAKAGCCTGAGLPACQRKLGQCHLFRRSGFATVCAASRIQQRPEPPAMAGGRRFLASGRGADRDFIRHQSGHPRCSRRLVAGPGSPLSQLHLRDRRTHCRSRIHQ